MGKYWQLRTLSAGAALLLLANFAQAQGTATGGTTTGTTGGATTGGTTGGTTSTGSTSSTSLGSSTGINSLGTTATTGTTGGARGGGTSTIPAIPATSDPYTATYGNPRYMGLSNVATAFSYNANGSLVGTAVQGGFGQPTYTATTAVASPTNIGASNINNGGFSSVNTPRTPSYRTILSEDLPLAAPVPARIQGDIIRSIANSPFLRDPRGIFLAVDGSTVLLKGQVATEKERRIVEGVARLTPGVRNVVNELVAVSASKQ